MSFIIAILFLALIGEGLELAIWTHKLQLYLDKFCYQVLRNLPSILDETRELRLDDGLAVKENATFPVEGNDIRVVNGTKLWPDGIVPFAFDRSVDRELKFMIWKAFQEIETKTCIQFIPKARTKSKDNVIFYGKGGCGSSRGMLHDGGEQALFLGANCHRKGVVFHELFHLFGFSHEHNRPDRDDYLTVNLENVENGSEHKFVKNPANETIILNAFDFDSIMMYDAYAFTNGPFFGPPVLVPKVEASEDFGHAWKDHPSESDYWRLNKLYKCDKQ